MVLRVGAVSLISVLKRSCSISEISIRYSLASAVKQFSLNNCACSNWSLSTDGLPLAAASHCWMKDLSKLAKASCSKEIQWRHVQLRIALDDGNKHVMSCNSPVDVGKSLACNRPPPLEHSGSETSIARCLAANKFHQSSHCHAYLPPRPTVKCVVGVRVPHSMFQLSSHKACEPHSICIPSSFTCTRATRRSKAQCKTSQPVAKAAPVRWPV